MWILTDIDLCEQKWGGMHLQLILKGVYWKPPIVVPSNTCVSRKFFFLYLSHPLHWRALLDPLTTSVPKGNHKNNKKLYYMLAKVVQNIPLANIIFWMFVNPMGNFTVVPDFLLWVPGFLCPACSSCPAYLNLLSSAVLLLLLVQQFLFLGTEWHFPAGAFCQLNPGNSKSLGLDFLIVLKKKPVQHQIPNDHIDKMTFHCSWNETKS